MTVVEAQATLPFAGLHVLLLSLADSFPSLDPSQDRALRIALALDEGEEADILAVNAGTPLALAVAASAQPLLIVVDDAQWLDRPSADALALSAGDGYRTLW